MMKMPLQWVIAPQQAYPRGMLQTASLDLAHRHPQPVETKT